jgi:hypothetical protein
MSRTQRFFRSAMTEHQNPGALPSRRRVHDVHPGTFTCGHAGTLEAARDQDGLESRFPHPSQLVPDRELLHVLEKQLGVVRGVGATSCLASIVPEAFWPDADRWPTRRQSSLGSNSSAQCTNGDDRLFMAAPT